MPSYVIKVDPSRDEYVYWSTVVEAPLFWGDAIAMHSYLEQHAEQGDGRRIDRADEHGTSCMDLGNGLRFYDWSTGGLIYKQRGIVNRDDLWALCRRLDRDEDVADLLRHFDDCECDEALDATERERDEARGLAERFQRTYYGDQTAEQRLAAVREVCANPDDTQWWEVVPYMEPPNDDEVTEVQVVTVDRILAALGDAEEADHG